MKKIILNKYNIIVVIIMLLLMLVGCNKTTNEEDNSNKNIDEYGYLRPNEGVFSEYVILNQENYDKYKNNLLGDSGESKLLNKELLDKNENVISNNKYYFIYLFYGNNVSILNTYFRTTLSSKNGILIDNEALSFGDISYTNYVIENRVQSLVKCKFDNNLEPYERLKLEYDNTNFDYVYFSFCIPFVPKSDGILDISYMTYNNIGYEYKKNINLMVGLNDNKEEFVKINNYSINFISETLCQNGRIDDSLLSIEPRIVRNYARFMVIDLDIDVLKDNNGMQKLYFSLYSYNPKEMDMTIEDVPTNDIEENKANDIEKYNIGITIPREKNTNKNYRLVIRLLNHASKDADISVFMYGDIINLQNYKNNNIIAKANYGLNFEEKDDYYSVTLEDKSLTEITIPAYYNDKIVQIDGNAFAENEKLTSVILEEGIEIIEFNAFKNCINLKNVTIPISIKHVGGYAFDGCNDALYNYYDGGKYLGIESNKYFILLNPVDNNIESFSLNPNTKIIANHAFENHEKLKKVNLFNVEIIGTLAFYNCDSLTNIVIPQTTRKLWHSVFTSCDSLEEVIVLSEDITFATRMFSVCNSLKTMTLPFVGSTRDENTYLGYLFGAEKSRDNEKWVPSSLKEIKLSSCEKVYENTFRKCTSLTNVIIEEGVKSIENRAFLGCTSLLNVSIPETVLTIDEYAFADCTSLKNVILSETVIKIGKGAFYGCESIESMSLPFVGGERDNNTYFGYIFGADSASDNLEYVPEKLTNISITSCEKIANRAFVNCKFLVEIKLPNNLISIGISAFTNCSSLISIEIPQSVTEIGEYALQGCSSLKKLVVPFIGPTLDESSTLNYLVADFRGYASIANLADLSITKAEVIADNAFFDSNIKNIELPNTIKSIGKSPFNSDLTNVYYNGSVNDWLNVNLSDCYSNGMNYANNFYFSVNGEYNLLTEIIIPDNITEIGNYQFYGFKQISKITFNNSVKSIGEYAFAKNEEITELIIPNSVEEIGVNAFIDCNKLKNISIPFVGLRRYDENDELKENLSAVFGEVISNITDLTITDSNYIPKSIGVLSNIINLNLSKSINLIDEDAFLYCSSLKNLYYDGTINDWCNIEFVNEKANPMRNANNFYYKDNNEYKLLNNLELSNEINKIGNYQFYGFNNITEAIIPNSILSIGKDAFNNCENLIKISLPFIGDKRYDENDNDTKTIEYILGDNAKNITNLKITDSNYIPANGLIACTKLHNLTITSSIKKIGSDALKKIYLTNIYYDGTIKDWCSIEFVNKFSTPMLGSPEFYINTSNGYDILTKLNIPNDIEKINDYQFLGFGYVNELIIPNSIKEIGVNAFLNMVRLKEVIVPNSVNLIKEGAFEACYNLEKLVLPFAGSKRYEEKELNQYPLGYIFGSLKYSFMTPVVQCYYGNSLTELTQTTYYISPKLNNITITDCDYMPYGCLSGISKLESLSIPFVGRKQYEEKELNQYPFGYIFGELSYSNSYAATEYYYGNSLTELTSTTYYIPQNLKNITITNTDYMSYGCLSGINSLEKLYIPFVGEKRYEKTAEDQYPLGFIFGEEEYQGSQKVSQGYYIKESSSLNRYTSKDYYIPSSLKEIYVTDCSFIHDAAFSGCDMLTKIEIPNTLTSIKSSVFAGCSNLLNISIPDSVTTIEMNAFRKCSLLTSIIIPGNVKKIKNNAFENCNNLVDVYFNGTIEDWCNIEFSDEKANPMYYASNFYILDDKGVISYNDMKYNLITELEIPLGVTRIGDYQFYGFNNITNIELSESIKSIGLKAFSKCISLNNINIPNSVINVSNSAFDDTNDGWFTEYNNCLYFGDESNKYKILLKIVDDSATELEINPLTTHIASQAFYGNKNITNLNLSSNIIFIGNMAFCNCSSIENINFNENLKYIGDSAFSSCKSLTNLNLSYNLEYIGDYAFNYCSNLINIKMDNSKHTIGKYVFNNCSNLTNVYYKGSIEDWCQIIFEDYTSNPMRIAKNFYIYDNLGIVLYDGDNYSSLTELIIPNGVETIGKYQFYYFKNITKVVLPDTITELQYYSFYGCNNLEDVKLSKNLTMIGEAAFYNCKLLNHIEIYKKVELIDSFAFYGTSVSNVYYEGNVDDFNNININSTGNSTFLKATITYNYSDVE